MNTLKVEVTSEDIAQGERGSLYHCPLALALGRVTGAPRVRVRRIVAHLPTAEDWPSDPLLVSRHVDTWYLSRAAQRFTLNFDAGREVRPATFRLRSAQ
jgi:hypothetical protein